MYHITTSTSITISSVYFTCIPPLKISLTYEVDLSQQQNEIPEVEVVLG